MQTSGGYKYPTIWKILSLLAICITILVYWFKNLSAIGGLSLFLNLEGTVLLASSLTPDGLLPPPNKFIEKIKWFFSQQNATPFKFYPPMLFAGLFLMFLAAITSAME